MQWDKYIIFFDGECNFCNYWINYIIKKDKEDSFRFISLQSKQGIEYLKKYKITSNLDSIILTKDHKYFIKSSAILHILKILGGFKSIFFILILVPKLIRDFSYDRIAKNRKNWFNSLNCNINDNECDKDKFLM